MKVLLDTHAFLWLISGDDRLSETAQKTFLEPRQHFVFQCGQFMGDLHKNEPGQAFPKEWLVKNDSR